MRGGTEVKSLFHFKVLRCYFKGQGCASCVSAAKESFYLHGFIAHVEKEEEEGEESVNKTDLRSESELVKQNMKKVYLQLAARFFFSYMQKLRGKRVSGRLLVHFFFFLYHTI